MHIKVNSNSKLEHSGRGSYLFGHFSLPAIQTCPNAGACKIGCYATQGRYKFSNVQKSYRTNWELTRNLAGFKETMQLELEALQARATKQNLRLALRIHTSGDFYSPGYYSAWVDLAEANPNVQFYAYTKMIGQSFNRVRPFNLCLIFSEGGIQDSLIQDYHRHARVFSSHEELNAAGYDDASEDDSVAFLSRSGKIGLVYHGSSRRAFDTTKSKSDFPAATVTESNRPGKI